jgi:hypothetical protein
MAQLVRESGIGNREEGRQCDESVRLGRKEDLARVDQRLTYMCVGDLRRNSARCRSGGRHVKSSNSPRATLLLVKGRKDTLLMLVRPEVVREETSRADFLASAEWVGLLERAGPNDQNRQDRQAGS